MSLLDQFPGESVALKFARRYRARGWFPIPIAHRQKGPTAPNWQDQRLSPEDVETRFRGEVNVGVLLGEPSGWLVDVDLDCPEAVELAPKFLPPTLTFGRASNPRSHWLYVSVGAEYQKFTAKLNAKNETLLELRSGVGKQTVFPGSVHPSGEAITFDGAGDAAGAVAEVSKDDLTRAVTALAAAVREKLGLGGSNAEGGTGLGKPVPPPVLNGPDSLSEFDKAVAAYNAAHPIEFNEARECPICEHQGCFGPLAGNADRWACFSTAHEGGVKGTDCYHGDALDLTALSSGKSRAEVLRAAGLLGGEYDLVDALSAPEPSGVEPDEEQLLEEIKQAIARAVSRRTGAMARPESFAATTLEVDPPEQWLVEEILDDGAFTEVVGRAKASKTWLLIHLAACIASGRPVFGHFQVKRTGPVVLLLREDARTKGKRRIRAELAGLGLSGEELAAATQNIFVWFGGSSSAVNIADELSFARFLLRCKQVSPVAVFMDPLRQLHDEDENSNTDMAPIMRRFLAASEILGCTVVLSHHSGKPNEATGKTHSVQMARGASVIGDMAEGYLAFMKTDDGERNVWVNTINVLSKNGGGAGLVEATLEIEDDENHRAVRTKWSYARAGRVKDGALGEAAIAVKRELQRRLLEGQIHHRDPEPASIREIAKATNRGDEVVRRALQEQLAPMGLVKRSGHDRGGRGGGWVLIDTEKKEPLDNAHVLGFIEDRDGK